MNKTWGIIGLGWLGSALAEELRKRGCRTWGTHSSQFDFSLDPFPDTTCDVLFLNAPPLPQLAPKTYVEKVRTTKNQRILFISSTSVYGPRGRLINESSRPEAQTESARWLVEVEKGLQEKFNDKVTVIRPGGLIGGDRHPIHFLAQRGSVSDSHQVVNLIHRSDLIHISLAAANGDQNIPIINAVAPFHPTKASYYKEWAERLRLKQPTFSGASEPIRQIDSSVLPTLYLDWVCPRLDWI